MGIVRIGIVGCGEVAQIIHLPILRELSALFRVTALCDVSRHVLETVGERWGVARRFLDHRDLVACEEVDAVLVANPHVHHCEAALAAMRAGKHVLVEKPMCITLAQADALIAEQTRSAVVAQVGYMRRYAPAFTEAKRLVRDLSDIRLARVHDVIGRNALIIGQVADVVRPVDLPAAAADELRLAQSAQIAEAIGPAPPALENAYALLLGLSSHDISAMRELLGMPDQVLYAACRNEDGRTISAAFDYGGFVCQFETGIDLIPRFDAHIEVFTPSRIVRIEYETPYIRNMPCRLLVTDVDHLGMARTAESLAWRDPFSVEWEAFHASVTKGAAPKTSLADAGQDLLLFQEMIKAMRASAPATCPASRSGAAQ
ncbi:MAG: Gfo/Idh/MocA family oxidoreductase [Hyphomicrobiales bacterium]